MKDFSADASKVLATTDNLALSAHGSVTLENEVLIGGAEADLIALTGSISQVDVAGDSVTSEALRANAVTAVAQTGIDLRFLRVSSIDALNKGSGDLRLNELGAGRDLEVIRARQDDPNGAGDIEITTEDGQKTVSDGGQGIQVAGSGDILLSNAQSSAGIFLGAAAETTTGRIRMVTPANLVISAPVRTGVGLSAYEGAPTGTVYLEALSGSVEIQHTVETKGAPVALRAYRDITTGQDQGGTTMGSIQTHGGDLDFQTTRDSISMAAGTTFATANTGASGSLPVKTSPSRTSMPGRAGSG